MKNIYLVVLGLLVSVSVTMAQSRVYAPELQSPENGAIDQMPEVVLNWHAVTGVGMDIQYEVQLSADDAFTNPIEFPFTGVTALSASGLMFGDTYYWHVRAHDGDDVSDWSETWSFAVLTSVEITSPTDGSIATPKVSIEWKPVTGVDFYQILVDTLYSWKSETVGTTTNINATFVIDANNYGGVGDDGLVFYYDGSWNIGESGTTKDLMGIYFVSPDDGWAVGKGGTVIHFDGNTWTTEDVGATKDLYAVSFADANNGWIVGKSGVVYYYNGTEWTSQDAGTSKNLNAVWAVSPTDVWAAGKSGTITHFDGSTWSSDTPGSKDFWGLWFNSADDGWAVGSSGRVAHYDGTSWTEENTGVSKILYGVAFNGSQGYIVGQTGTLLEYNGTTWNKITSGTTNNILGIWFADGAGLYGGKSGIAYTYTGGGFNSPYVTTYNVNGDSTSYYLQNLYFGSTYYYKMRMGHSNDTSDWSFAKSFQVQRSPELLAPNDGESDVELELLFEWKNFEGILKYNVQISDNPDFINAFTYFSDSNSIYLDGLNFGTTYYWRVNAQHAAGVSPWSETWSFTTVNSITLTSPENNATDVSRTPLLKWDDIAGVIDYQVWMDTVNTFPNPVVSTVSTPFSQVISKLQQKTTYYWKVRGIVALDTSGWSPVWSFVTTGPDAINEIEGVKSVSIYPNPASSNFTIQMNSLSSDDIQIQITDVTGKVVYDNSTSFSVGNNIYTINAGNFSSGIYHVNIIKGDAVISRKLMIK